MKLFIVAYAVGLAVCGIVIAWDIYHLRRSNRPNRRLNSWKRWLPLGRSWRRLR